MHEPNNLKFIGVSNAWTNIPIELKECKEHNHVLTIQTISNCYKSFTCPICKIIFETDSSD
jgi:hypothetical protein